MTRIDFHSNVGNRIAYTCRLIRKARQAQCRIVLFSDNHDQIAELDQTLYTFSALDFLPHVYADDPLAAQTPVILSQEDDRDFPHYQVLINLSQKTPAVFARFERMFEIISADEADKVAGRERYRHYQQRGYPLTHFVAENT